MVLHETIRHVSSGTRTTSALMITGFFSDVVAGSSDHDEGRANGPFEGSGIYVTKTHFIIVRLLFRS
jgi:hypothetical protein